MKVSEFDFYLPEELIAQHPLKQRDSSRLMVLDKNRRNRAQNISWCYKLLKSWWHSCFK